MRGHMTGGFCFTKLIRMAPLPSGPDTLRCVFVVVSLGLPDEGSELRETEFFTLAMTDARIQTQGCRPQSPALSAAPCRYVFFLLRWGETPREPRVGWKNWVHIRFKMCLSYVLTAWVSFSLCRLPVQPRNGHREHRWANISIRKETNSFLRNVQGSSPAHPLPDHILSQLFIRSR